MDVKERVLTALRGGTPDRVPVTAQWNEGFATMVAETDWRRFRAGWDYWRALCEAHWRLGTDAFQTWGEPVEFDVHWEDGWGDWEQTLEHGYDYWIVERKIETPLGNLRSRVKRTPLTNWRLKDLVEGPEDWRIYKAYMEEWLRLAEPNVERYDAAVDEIGDRGVLTFHLNAAWDHLGNQRGFENMIADTFRYPDLVKELIEVAGKVMMKRLDFFNECKGEVLQFVPYYAAYASPKIFKDWELQDLHAVMNKVDKDRVVGVYLCGPMKHFLPYLVEAGVDYVEDFPPASMGGDITLGEAKKKYGRQICLLGGFNILLLPDGTPDQIRAEAKRCMDEAKEGGGYVFGTTDQVPYDATVENVKLMVEAAMKHAPY